MPSAFNGDFKINNTKVKSIATPPADNKYFLVQVQPDFVQYQ